MKKLSRLVMILVILISLSITVNANENFTTPGLKNIGTHFELNNSDYLNITLDSSEPIDLILESIPEIVTMHIKSVSNAMSTEITLSGFVPLTTYHKYEDDFHNHTTFKTDTNGNYSYVQNISSGHIVFIQTKSSTKFIKDDMTGGDCTSMGIWNSVTKTCTLTSNPTDTIQIDNNGITLDGNYHTMTAGSSGYCCVGIYLGGKSGVTIKNLIIKGFSYAIFVASSSGNNIVNNDVNHNDYGISLWYDSKNNNIANSRTNNNNWGIVIVDSSSNSIVSNTADANQLYGISIWWPLSKSNIINNNNINLNNRGIIIVSSSGNVLRNNIMANNKENFGFWMWEGQSQEFNNDIDKSNLVNDKPIYYMIGYSKVHIDVSSNAGAVYCFNCNEISIDGIMPTHNSQGIYFFNTKNSMIENNDIRDNGDGILLYMSDNIDVTDNTISHNGNGIRSLFGNDNIFYRNNLMNIIQNAYDSGVNSIWDNYVLNEGNYYSDFDEPIEGCNDSNNDDRCDNPHLIPGGNNVDNNPVIEPYTLSSGTIDLSIEYIDIEPTDPVVDKQLTINVDINNLGREIIADQDIYIRLMYDTDVLEEKKFSFSQIDLKHGVQTISKTFLMGSDKNHDILFLVNAIEVEIKTTSGDYKDIDLYNNKKIKEGIYTKMSLDDKINCLFLGITAHIGALDSAFTIIESDQELKDILGDFRSLLKDGKKYDALDMYKRFLFRLIRLVSVDADQIPGFVYNYIKNTIVNILDLAKCGLYNTIDLWKMISHLITELKNVDILHGTTTTYFFNVESPVDIEVVDSNSQQHTGYINGNIITNIEDSYVKVIGSKKTVIIFGKHDSNYLVKLKGTVDGTFNFNMLDGNVNIIKEYKDITVNLNSIATLKTESNVLNMDYNGDGIVDDKILPNIIEIENKLYNISFLSPTENKEINISKDSILPIKFSVSNSATDEFIYDETVKVSIIDSIGNEIVHFIYGTDEKSVKIDTEKELYLVDFNAKDYPLKVGDTYTVEVTFGESDSLKGYDVTYFKVVDRQGGSSVSIIPRSSDVINGNNIQLNIKAKNTQNVFDTFRVHINTTELPVTYRADISWFEWTEKIVNLKSGEEINIPINVTIPSGITGNKMFRARINSTTSSKVYAFDTGTLKIT